MDQQIQDQLTIYTSTNGGNQIIQEKRILPTPLRDPKRKSADSTKQPSLTSTQEIITQSKKLQEVHSNLSLEPPDSAHMIYTKTQPLCHTTSTRRPYRKCQLNHAMHCSTKTSKKRSPNIKTLEKDAYPPCTELPTSRIATTWEEYSHEPQIPVNPTLEQLTKILNSDWFFNNINSQPDLIFETKLGLTVPTEQYLLPHTSE